MANKNRWAKYVLNPTVVVFSTLALIGGVSPVAQAQTTQASENNTYSIPCDVDGETPAACTLDIKGKAQHSTDADIEDLPLLPSEMFDGIGEAVFSLELGDKTVKAGEKLEVTREIAPGVTATATYEVADNGVVTFTPGENFVGEAAKVTVVATVAPDDAYEGTYQAVVVPVLEDVTVAGEPGKPVDLPFDLNTGVDPSSLRFGDDLNSATTSKTVEGEGEWTVNPKDGTVTFTPESGFTKAPTPVAYIGKSRDGVPAFPGTLTVTVADKAPVAGGSAEAGEWIKKIIPFTPLLLIPLLGGIFGSSDNPVVSFIQSQLLRLRAMLNV
ncbi:hypothetical protein [Corynebacterium sp. HS2168-gen11]|uniref:hypothetical protein n=1 Tax=Corynebacterium sp. HS2168-gen11 TaxID=2974027 RepID=UPI00216B1CF9|nr:hypothetical protein [Corynebacterium sp. HS2168-gen11]MCS4536508.1 hypothetical protein [Corynebacterium sp. HS2168-gen11]